VQEEHFVATSAHDGRIFWRHFWQMLRAMAIGMIATGAIFVAVTGAASWDEVTTVYPNQALAAMAVGMTVPMAAWMVHRGMGWRNTAEMSAAMLPPSSRSSASSGSTSPGVLSAVATASRPSRQCWR